MQPTSRLDDLILRALLDGAGIVLFEERGARGLARRAVEAARLCGRARDLAVLDLSTRPGPEASRRDAVGLDLATMPPEAAAEFVADLAVPAGVARGEVRDGVRAVARGYLDLVRGPPVSLADLAGVADAPGRDGLSEIRLALARLKLHLHRHARCLDPDAMRGLDPDRAANGGSVLVVQHDPGARGDLLAAVAGLLARTARPGAGTLWAVRDPGMDPRPSPCLGALARAGLPLRHEAGGWVRLPEWLGYGDEPAEERLRAMRDAFDLAVETELGRGVVAVGRDGDRVLAAVRGGEVSLVVRERDGWVGTATLTRPEPGPVPRYLAHALALAALRGLVGTGAEAGRIEVPGAGAWVLVPADRQDRGERLGRLAATSAVAGRFVAGLDLDLREACLDAGRGDLHVWVARRGGDARARRDFVCTWRALSILACRPGFGAAVDAGARTVPLVAACLGIDAAKARRLQGRATVPQAWLDDIEAGGAAPFPLAALDVNHMPRVGDGPEWAAFVRCVDALDGLRARLIDPDPAVLVGLALRSGRDWRDRAARLPVGADAVIDAADMVRALGRHLHATDAAGDAAMAEDLALRLLARRRDLAGLVALSRDWHADPGTGPHAFAPGVPDEAVRWPSLFEGAVELPGAYRALALTTLGDLRREGARGADPSGHAGLDHCVADYARACASGRSHIVSLRGADGRRVSTVEIVRGAAGEAVLAQHRARGNAEPPPDARRAAEALLRSLDAVVPALPAVRGPGSGVREAADLESRHAAWRPYLPDRLSGFSLERFVARLAGSGPGDGHRGARPGATA